MMKATREANLEFDYSDGRTKQAYKDQCDVNKIIEKASRGESLSHLERHGGIYGDFTDMPDLLEAQARLARGQEIFDELPASVRKEFNNSPGEFFAYVNDPDNIDDLRKKLPEIAAPGRQIPDVNRTARSVADPRIVDPEPDPAPDSGSGDPGPDPASSTT
mgnify:CR=1 FL=1